MLEVANLEVVYNEVILVLRGLSVQVPDGQIVALLGSNGAGKTTTARAITGLLDVHEGKVTKGSVTWNGAEIGEQLPAKIVESGISQVMEGRRIFGELTVDENLSCGAFTNRANMNANYERVMDLFPQLKERNTQVAGYLSGGEQADAGNRSSADGRAEVAHPRRTLARVFAPMLIEQIRDIIVDINKQGVSVLLIEQNAMMALSIADFGYVMESGKVVMDGPAQKLLNDEDVQEFYLGLHGDGGERKSFRDVKHYKRRKRWLS